MADYIGSARTNYFKVRDKADAEAWAERWGFDMCRHDLDPSAFCFLSSHEHGWPDEEYDDDGEAIEGPSLEEQFREIAAPNEIVIMMETGAERLRYLVGYATAIRNGESIHIGLNDIYDLAKAKWGVEPTRAGG